MRVTHGQIAQARAYSALLRGLSKWAAQTVLLEESEQRFILQLEQELGAVAGVGDVYRMEKIRRLLANAHGRIGSIVNEMQRRAAVATPTAEDGAEGREFHAYLGEASEDLQSSAHDDGHDADDNAAEGDEDDETRLGEISRRFFDAGVTEDEEGGGGGLRHGHDYSSGGSSSNSSGGSSGNSSSSSNSNSNSSIGVRGDDGGERVDFGSREADPSAREEHTAARCGARPATRACTDTKVMSLRMRGHMSGGHHHGHIMPHTRQGHSPRTSPQSITKSPLLMMSVVEPPPVLSRCTTPSFITTPASPLLFSAEHSHLGMSKLCSETPFSSFAGGVAMAAEEAMAIFSPNELEPIAYSVVVPVKAGDVWPIQTGDARTPMQGPRLENEDNAAAVAVLPFLTPSIVEARTMGAGAANGPPRGITRGSSLVSSYFR